MANSLDLLKNTLLGKVRAIDAQQEQSSTPFPHYLLNKIAHTLSLIFIRTYLDTWKTAVKDVAALAITESNTNKSGAIVFLRFLGNVNEDVAEGTASWSRTEGTTKGLFKDALRANEIEFIVECLFGMMVRLQNDVAVVNLCLQVVGDLSIWIDLGLVVNERTLPIIFTQMSRVEVRCAACQAICQFIAKKMMPEPTLELVSVFNAAKINQDFRNDDDEEFSLKLAQLVNAQCQALVHVASVRESVISAENRELAKAYLSQLLPHVVTILAGQQPSVVSALLPCLTDYFAALKRNMYLKNIAYLRDIFAALYKRMRLADDYDWEDEEDINSRGEEDESVQLRSKLKVFQPSIMLIDEKFYAEELAALIGRTLQDCKSGVTSDWRDLELGLTELYLFAEGSKRAYDFKKPSSSQFSLHEYVSRLLSIFFSLDHTLFSHPATQLLYMKLCIRYISFIEANISLIPEVLEFFLKDAGVYSAFTQVRLRAPHDLHRLVSRLSDLLKPSAKFLISVLRNSLTIEYEPLAAKLRDQLNGDTLSIDPKFDSQIYLFEAAGFLAALPLPIDDETSASYYESLLRPFANSAQECLLYPPEPIHAIVLHHSFFAMGSIANGFRQSSKKSTPKVEKVFEDMSLIIVQCLEARNAFAPARVAARHCISVFLGIIKAFLLPHVPKILHLLLNDASLVECRDLTSFIIQLRWGYGKDMVPAVKGVITPLFNKIFVYFGQAIEGTDDALEQSALRDAYLSLLLSFVNVDAGEMYWGILTSPGMAPFVSTTANRLENLPILENVLQSVIHLLKDSKDQSVQRSAIAVLRQMIVCMDLDSRSRHRMAFTEHQPNGLSRTQLQTVYDEFIFASVISVCFQLQEIYGPNDTQGFTNKSHNAQQFGHILKDILELRGDDFVNYLKYTYFPKVGVPPDGIEEYIKQLKRMSAEDFGVYHEQFVRQS